MSNNTSTNTSASKDDVRNQLKYARKFANAATGIGAAASIGGGALAYRQGDKIAGYISELSSLKRKERLEGLTPEEKKRKRILILKTAGRGAIGAASLKAAKDGAKAAINGGMAIHATNKALKELQEAFLEGYYDALEEIEYYEY